MYIMRNQNFDNFLVTKIVILIWQKYCNLFCFVLFFYNTYILALNIIFTLVGFLENIKALNRTKKYFFL